MKSREIEVRSYPLAHLLISRCCRAIRFCLEPCAIKKGYFHSFSATKNVLTANRRKTEYGLASGHTRRFPKGVRFKVTGLPLIAIKVVRLMG
jgi:hypothetical protein